MGHALEHTRLLCSVDLIEFLAHTLVLHPPLHHDFVVAPILRPIKLVRILLYRGGGWYLVRQRDGILNNSSSRCVPIIATTQNELLRVVHIVPEHTSLGFFLVSVGIVQV